MAVATAGLNWSMREGGWKRRRADPVALQRGRRVAARERSGKKTGSGTLVSGGSLSSPQLRPLPFWTSTGPEKDRAQLPLKKKLNWAGARADCSTRGAAGVAGRGATAGLALRAAEALGASWIDMVNLPAAVSGPARPQPSEPLRCGFGRGRDHRRRGRVVVVGPAIGPGCQCPCRWPATSSACRQPQQRRGAAPASRGRRARGKGAQAHRQLLRVPAPTKGAHAPVLLQFPCRGRRATGACAISHPGAPALALRGDVRTRRYKVVQHGRSCIRRCPDVATRKRGPHTRLKRPQGSRARIRRPRGSRARIRRPRGSRAEWPPAAAACTPREARPGSARCPPARRRRRPSTPAPRR